ncbi:hypothetical protein ACN47E_002126 [Coniothyrium glycines]
MRIPLFRIWYSTTYTTLLIVLLILLAITPADTIYQSIKSGEIQKLFVIGGVYLLTVLIVLLIYSTRIYTNRTVLGGIPKGYIPVEDGEIGRGVRKMIVRHLRRSAVIAWDSRPRDVRDEEGLLSRDLERTVTVESKRQKTKEKRKKDHHHDSVTTLIHVDAASPPWGHVAHQGWASPSSPDLPNLQYWSVICELPNLIEAKAVSLAPPDPVIEEQPHRFPDNAPPLPDAQVVGLLQRPRSMGLREYLARLSGFGLLNPPDLGPSFLAQYEYARFSTTSLTEEQFRNIMAIFANILNGMTDLDPVIIEDARAQAIEFDTRSLAPTEYSSTLSSSSSSHSSLPDESPQPDLNCSTSWSARSEIDNLSINESTYSPQTARTAPSRQQQRSSGIYATPRASSERSLPSQLGSDTGSIMIHPVQRSPSAILSSSSTSSLRSGRSVIRLHPNPGAGELPYQYVSDGG